MLTTNGSLAVEAGVDRFGDDRVRVRRLLGHASDRSFEDGALVGAHGGSVATASDRALHRHLPLGRSIEGIVLEQRHKRVPPPRWGRNGVDLRRFAGRGLDRA
jgi:hypothetical protein